MRHTKSISLLERAMKVFKARALMALNPGFLMAGNVATRLDVPIESENGVSLGQLFFF